MEKTLGVTPISMLIAAALIYGLVFPFNALATEAGATFFGHAFWQVFTGGVALFAVALARGRTVSFRWTFFRAYVMVGAFGFGLPMALLTLAGPHLPKGILPLVLALSPIFTYLVSTVFRLDRMSIYGVIGIALGFGGVAVVLAPDSALPGEDSVSWFMLALIVPFMLAIANVSAALLRPPETTSVVMGSGFLLGAAISLFPLMLIFGQFYVPASAGLLVPTLGSAAVNGVFIVLFAEIVRRFGPTFFAQFNYLAVVAALGWAFVFFAELPSVYALVALALMATGVLISELRHRGRDPAP
ncbi:MAG: DMT family transporter [Minwuia sp.]|uniref:DMT family transporter n=1 Tax=Minwuia sp. TaxID=2493630 RepID=UPI003A837C53